MKSHVIPLCAVLFSLAGPAWADPAEPLARFKAYEQGKPVEWLTAARQAVFEGTADGHVLAAREQALVGFLSSDAHPQAKAIVIEWLGCLGSARCIPALVEARDNPELAAAATAALAKIPGPDAAAPRTQAQTTPADTLKPAVAAVVDLTTAVRANKPGDPKADDLLLKALTSNHKPLVLAALRLVREGSGGPELAKKCVDRLRDLPIELRPVLLDCLAARPDPGHEFLHDFLQQVVRAAPPEEQAVALRTLGRILRPADVPLLLQAATAKHADIASAARDGLARATAPGIDQSLLEIARGADTEPARAAIAALAARDAAEAVPVLWKIADQPGSTLANAALDALGLLLPPETLPDLLGRLVAAADTPRAADLAKTTWDVLRRHPDPATAADLLEKTAATAPASLKETLTRYANRIRPKPSAAAGPTLDLPTADDRAALAPRDHQRILDMDCGSFAKASSGKITVHRTAGDVWQFGSVAHPLATVDFGKQVAYQIDGLAPNFTYVLGLSAWDADRGGRRQSIEIDGKPAVPGMLPLAWHADKPTYTRLHLPLPADAVADGKVTVTVNCEAGPNAVVSQLWLLERVPPSPGAIPRKRILLVTGDDFPAHLWRQTGPEFAAILQADPALEVTVCESPFVLGSPLLAHYDAVFLHFKNYSDRLPLGETVWKNFEAYIHGGGGMVVAHFGCGALQEWHGFVQLAGRVWDPKKRGHDPYGEFLVRIVASGHPAVRGLRDFTTTDELYTCLVGDPAVTTLAEATSKIDQSVHPMAFVLTPGKGRVFHCPLGHDLGALKSQGAQALYRNGSRWAAGL